MNKKLLLALYDRSGLGAHMPVDYKGHELEVAEHMEKFAELIIRECIQVCADRGEHHDRLYSAWADDCSKRIGKHFGVEE